MASTMVPQWEQAAWWYLAGLNDASRKRFPHDPTSQSGKEFVAAWTEASQQAWETHGYLYLPDFYREWVKSRSRAQREGSAVAAS